MFIDVHSADDRHSVLEPVVALRRTRRSASLPGSQKGERPVCARASLRLGQSPFWAEGGAAITKGTVEAFRPLGYIDRGQGLTWIGEAGRFGLGRP